MHELDDYRSDYLTKAFACTGSRRGELRLIGGALAGAYGTRAATVEAARGDRCTSNCYGDSHCDDGICCNPQWKNCCGRCIFETLNCCHQAETCDEC